MCRLWSLPGPRPGLDEFWHADLRGRLDVGLIARDLCRLHAADAEIEGISRREPALPAAVDEKISEPNPWALLWVEEDLRLRPPLPWRFLNRLLSAQKSDASFDTTPACWDPGPPTKLTQAPDQQSKAWWGRQVEGGYSSATDLGS